MPDGFNEARSSFLWKERISSSWGKHFANYERFLSAACQLEFVLELNSYFDTNTLGDPKIEQWIKANASDISFIYGPDLYSQDLSSTAPMAERCYDYIASEQAFPAFLAVEPAPFVLAFKDKTREQRLLIYGAFLHHLKVWQSTIMMQGLRRFPFMYDWQGKLKEAVEKYKVQLPRPK